ncbi:MAG: HisS family protein, partial [Beijerinckiaceae bacterium]
GDYVVKVNNRKILDGVMEAIGLGGEENAGRRLTVLRAIDKLDRLGVEGVKQLVGDGRKDESGDFTKGAGLSSEAIDRILNFTGWRESGSGSNTISGSSAVTIANFETAVDGNALGLEGVGELKTIAELINATGYSDRVTIDPSVVRGLEYYTGPVFECELTFPVKDENGKDVRFGSVGGGGRYDGLVARFRNEPVPATGFSIGVSRLVSALKTIKSPIVSGANDSGPVVVLVMDRDHIGDYQKMVASLRAANIRAEMYLGESGMKAQMKYADRRNSPCVIIQGSNERNAGEIQIKDLIEGAKRADAFRSNAEYRAARLAQFSCKASEMVAKVRELLGAHGIS